MPNNPDLTTLQEKYDAWRATYQPRRFAGTTSTSAEPLTWYGDDLKLVQAQDSATVWTEIWGVGEQYLINGFVAPGAADDILAYHVCAVPCSARPGTLRVVTQVSLECSRCAGEGFLDRSNIECADCAGQGYTEITFDA